MVLGKLTVPVHPTNLDNVRQGPAALAVSAVKGYLDIFLFSIISLFLCPHHKMAEGHIEFTLSVYLCVFVYSRIVSGPYFGRT